MKLILASSSPRRKEILENAGYAFEIVPSGADESAEISGPSELVKHLSRVKAEAVSKDFPCAVVIGADTVVSIGGSILQKPKDTEDAKAMLRLLSGKTHEVFTGVAVLRGGTGETFSVCSRVVFYALTEDLICRYAATGEPLDKAGGYGIQGRGSLLVREIEGDYFNIMGLPVAPLSRRLESLFGIRPFSEP